MFESIRSFFNQAPKPKTSGPGAGLADQDDDRFPVFQQAWKQGATHQDLFGDSPFQLHGSVGGSGADNHRPDVAKVETFLGDAGYYKPMTADGPTGWHNTNLDTAIKTFQKDHGLKVDGLLKPNGPTIGKIGGLLGGQTAAEPSGPAEPTTPGLRQQGGDAPAQPLGIREGEWDWRDRGSRQPKADSEQVEGVDYIEIHGWNPHAPPIRIPIGRRGQGPFDPFANHTITEEGAAEHDRYAQALVKDSDPSKTAAFLKNITDWYGDKGKGDVADLLGRFQMVDPDKAQHLQSEVAKLTGSRIPFRIAPTGGPMADLAEGDSDSVRLPKANPWGSAEGADPFEVKGMVDALKGKGDYQDAAKHFAGEFKRDPDWAKSYTAAVYDGLAKDSPKQAALFHTQMAARGLVPEQEQTEPATTAPDPADKPSSAPDTATTPAPQTPPPQEEAPVVQATDEEQVAEVPTQTPPGTPTSPAKEPAPPTTQQESKSPSRPPVDGHTITKSPEEIEKEAAANGGYLYTERDKERGNAQQCTAFVKKATGLGPASMWKAGEKINGPDDPPLKPGTAIATFNQHGSYGTDKGRHAAIFLGYTEKDGQKGMEVLEQSKERPVQRKFIPFTSGGKFIYQGQNYSVVK